MPMGHINYGEARHTKTAQLIEQTIRNHYFKRSNIVQLLSAVRNS